MKTPHINLDQLVTFYLVAREGSLSGASKKLFLTAPAVCMQIKALEKQFGVKLIGIKKKKVHLTQIGHILLPVAEQVYRSALKADTLLLNYKNNLRLGVSTALTPLFTPIVSKFKELHPSVSITFTEGRSLVLIEGLVEFQHDICIVATPPDISDELSRFRIPRPERLALVVSTASPMAEKSQISWRELHDYPMVLHGEGSLSRAFILREFEKRNVRPLIAATVESEESMKQFIQQGVGASFMVACNVEQEVAAGKLKIIPMMEGGVDIWINILYHKRMGLSPASKALLFLIGERFSFKIPVEQ